MTDKIVATGSLDTLYHKEDVRHRLVLMIVDTEEQLLKWCGRMDIDPAKVEDLEKFLHSDIGPDMSAMEKTTVVRMKLYQLPQQLTDDRFFVLHIPDYAKIKEQSSYSGIPLSRLILGPRLISDTIFFIPSEVYQFTENNATALRDKCGDKNKWLQSFDDVEPMTNVTWSQPPTQKIQNAGISGCTLDPEKFAAFRERLHTIPGADGPTIGEVYEFDHRVRQVLRKAFLGDPDLAITVHGDEVVLTYRSKDPELLARAKAWSKVL